MPEFLPVVPVSQLPAQGFKAVEVCGKAILIGQVNGQFFACLDRCPHAAAALRVGKLRGEELQCTRHGWIFNVLTGQSVPNDPAFCLTILPVKVEHDQLLVSL